MKVKMVTLAAGPEGMLRPGAEIDLPQEKAMALIEGGYAVPVHVVRETATVEPPEQAVEPESKPRRRRSTRKASSSSSKASN